MTLILGMKILIRTKFSVVPNLELNIVRKTYKRKKAIIVKMITISLTLFYLLAASTIQQSKVGFAYSPNPDAIRCGNYFYYLTLSTKSLSKYNANTGSSRSIESYDSNNASLSNKVGSLPGNC